MYAEQLKPQDAAPQELATSASCCTKSYNRPKSAFLQSFDERQAGDSVFCPHRCILDAERMLRA